MFVPCPHCQFLVAHHPQLRPLPADCPRCGRALQDAGEAPAADAGTDAEDLRPDDAVVPTAGSGTPDGGTAGNGATPAFDTGAEKQHSDASAVLDAAATPPARVIAQATAGRWSHARWPLIGLLFALLVLQVLLADRARLAADARWRPVVERMCGVLQCSLPPWDEPAAFTMLDRKVQPAAQSGALRVDATFRNDAHWPQAWPALQLALADADGHVLGSRVFQPADYLGRSPTALLSPGQSAQITFLVQEPAPGTVAFSFEFR